MLQSRLATRYAQALLDLAIEKKKLAAVYKDAESIKTTIANSNELFLMLKNPIISTEKKQKVLTAVFKKKGKVSVMTDKFIQLITSKNRESHLPEIFDAFISLYHKHNKTVEATAIVASAITPAIQKKLQTVIEKSTGSNKIKYDVIVDESILGGFILKFEDKIYDASIKRKLENLKKQFTA